MTITFVMDKLNFYVTQTVKMTFDHSEEDIFAIGTVNHKFMVTFHLF